MKGLLLIRKPVIAILLFMGLNTVTVNAQLLMTNGSASTCSDQFHDSGGSINDYGMSENYTYTINPASAGSFIEANFTYFSLENNSDFLYIYDGPSTASPLIGTYTGTSSPGTVTSTDASGALTFRFTSDLSVSSNGWNATISCMSPPTILISDTSPTGTCWSYFYDSGNSGGTYGNNEDYTHTITPATTGNMIQADFTSFDLENGFDYLYIYDGPSTASPLIGMYTGTTSPGTISSTDASGALTFRFTSNVSGSSNGWEATIFCVPPPPAILITDTSPSSTCSDNFYDSGNIGNTYSDNETDTLTIYPATTGNLIQVNFTMFDIELDYDFLYIYDGPSILSPVIGVFTGTTSPGTITSTDPSGALTFRFTSDLSITSNGWEAEISCVPPPTILISDASPSGTCMSNFYDSGNSGGVYGNNEDYTHSIHPTTLGNAIRVDFTSFDVESGFDYLYIYDGPTTGSPLIGSFTGMTSPGTITSTDASGALTFRFTSNSSVTSNGWEASIICVEPPDILISDPSPSYSCLSHFYDSGGSAGYYSSNEDFTHTISPSTSGNVIQANFTMFDVEINYDSLLIYDGPSTASPLIGTYTGTAGPGTITSTDISGALTFRFISDVIFTRPGWEAEIFCVQGAPCTEPDVPTLTASATTLCPGEVSTITISGNLNDATEWRVYSSSCGGTLDGTTATSTYDATVTSTTTYYLRGEGGCVVPGSCGQITITTEDTDAPVADSPTLMEVNENCSATPTAPTATDNCSGTVVGVPDVTFPITTFGTTMVTWTYNDGNGNTSTQTQNVTISDTEGPVADVATLADVTDDCSITPAAPTATDNCSGTITGVPDVTFPITTPGTTMITWTYDDGNGNTSMQTQNATVLLPDTSVTQTGTTLTANNTGANYQWIDCDDNYSIIPSATSQSYTPTDINGNYAVIVMENGCSDTSSCYNVDYTGIDKLDYAFEFNIYPNPTNGSMFVKISTKPDAPVDYDITDLNGRIVLSGKFTEQINLVNTEELNSGLYLIQINSRATRRFIKK